MVKQILSLAVIAWFGEITYIERATVYITSRLTDLYHSNTIVQGLYMKITFYNKIKTTIMVLHAANRIQTLELHCEMVLCVPRYIAIS